MSQEAFYKLRFGIAVSRASYLIEMTAKAERPNYTDNENIFFCRTHDKPL